MRDKYKMVDIKTTMLNIEGGANQGRGYRTREEGNPKEHKEKDTMNREVGTQLTKSCFRKFS